MAQHHYAGEYLRIAVRAKIEVEPGKLRDLLPEDVDVHTLSITLGNRTVVDAAPMTYDEDRKLWMYYWDTAGQSPGDYNTKAFFEGAQHRSWEHGTIKVEFDPTPVVVR